MRRRRVTDRRGEKIKQSRKVSPQKLFTIFVKVANRDTIGFAHSFTFENDKVGVRFSSQLLAVVTENLSRCN